MGLRRPSATGRRPGISGMRKRRGCPATDDRGRLVYQLIVLQCRDHEQGEVHAAGDVALKDGITHMSTPHTKALALTLFQIASAHDGPPRIAGEHPPTRFDLVVQVHRPNKLGEPPEDTYLPLEPARVDVLAVPRDVRASSFATLCSRHTPTTS
jgi:hypothetical protein